VHIVWIGGELFGAKLRHRSTAGPYFYYVGMCAVDAL